MDDTIKVTKIYLNPRHGVRVCNETIDGYSSEGYRLVSVEKDFVFGCGITFRYFFTRSDSKKSYKTIKKLGKLLPTESDLLSGYKINTILSMKTIWFSVGYFYILEKI